MRGEGEGEERVWLDSGFFGERGGRNRLNESEDSREERVCSREEI